MYMYTCIYIYIYISLTIYIYICICLELLGAGLLGLLHLLLGLGDILLPLLFVTLSYTIVVCCFV